MTDPVEEVNKLVSEMRESKSFSVLDAVREVTYPTTKVRVYTDGKAAGELEAAYADRKLELAENDAMASAELNEIEEAIADLEERIKGSALTFHLRGVPPKVKRIIGKESARKFKVPKDADDELRMEFFAKQNEYVTYELLRHSIIKVVNANGDEDTHAWTAKDIEELDSVLHESQFAKIDEACAKLTSAANLFNETLDADFLSQS